MVENPRRTVIVVLVAMLVVGFAVGGLAVVTDRETDTEPATNTTDDLEASRLGGDVPPGSVDRQSHEIV